MSDFISSSSFFGLWLTLTVYFIGRAINKKTYFRWLNPLLFSTVVIILLLLGTGTDYQTYNSSAQYLSYLLTPSTVCFGILLYKQWEMLKSNYKAILLGIGSGVLASLICVLGCAVIFGFTHAEYVTFLPKSITTAIGKAVSEELGGYPAITSLAIIISGIIGNITAEAVCRLFKITDPVAAGIAIGTSSHAIGTSKAIELGEVQGAMSSLSIVVAGLITVLAANLASGLY